MINGIINIYKEKGFTSFDVVAKLRGIVKQKKIGHTGTLDPDAVGVLPVCFGNATKLCDMLTDKSKEYVAEFVLGLTTDTQDISGKVLSRNEVHVTDDQVREAVMSFVGEYDQIPPMYSAIKINGKRLYELAREGKEVERKARLVEIPEIEILFIDLPTVKMRVACSKGTYIRTLCVDIGEKLGCGATMTELMRTKVGAFLLEDAYTLAQIEELVNTNKIDDVVLQCDAVFEQLKGVTVSEQAEKQLQNGNKLYPNQLLDIEGKEKVSLQKYKENEQVCVYSSEGIFKAVYSFVAEEECFKPVKMFLA